MAHYKSCSNESFHRNLFSFSTGTQKLSPAQYVLTCSELVLVKTYWLLKEPIPLKHLLLTKTLSVFRTTVYARQDRIGPMLRSITLQTRD